MNILVKVFAPVHPTEVEEKVRTAITNVFPLELHLQDSEIPQLQGEGDIETLRTFHQLLREEQILDTARSIFLKGMKKNTIAFSLNKQVAFVGKANFPAGDESLGSIHIKISGDNEQDLMKLIDWLAPQTKDGKPLEEIEL